MKIVKEYYNQVYNKAHRKSKKEKKKNVDGAEGKEKEELAESRESLNKTWRLANNHDTLFDIGRDMDSLSIKEKLFYRD